MRHPYTGDGCGITGRQKAVLQVIADRLASCGAPPTLREIGERMRIASTNGVNDHLKALEKKGLLARSDLLSRSLRVTRAGYEALGARRCETCGQVTA